MPLSSLLGTKFCEIYDCSNCQDWIIFLFLSLYPYSICYLYREPERIFCNSSRYRSHFWSEPWMGKYLGNCSRRRSRLSCQYEPSCISRLLEVCPRQAVIRLEDTSKSITNHCAGLIDPICVVCTEIGSPVDDRRQSDRTGSIYSVFRSN